MAYGYLPKYSTYLEYAIAQIYSTYHYFCREFYSTSEREGARGGEEKRIGLHKEKVATLKFIVFSPRFMLDRGTVVDSTYITEIAVQ